MPVLTRAGRARAAAGHPPTPPPPPSSSSASSGSTTPPSGFRPPSPKPHRQPAPARSGRKMKKGRVTPSPSPSPTQTPSPVPSNGSSTPSSATRSPSPAFARMAPLKYVYKQTLTRRPQLVLGLYGQLLSDGPTDTLLKTGDVLSGYSAQTTISGRECAPYIYSWSTSTQLGAEVVHDLLMRSLSIWENKDVVRCCACHNKDLYHNIGMWRVCRKCGTSVLNWRGVNGRCSPDEAFHQENTTNILEALKGSCLECRMRRCIIFGYTPVHPRVQRLFSVWPKAGASVRTAVELD